MPAGHPTRLVQRRLSQAGLLLKESGVRTFAQRLARRAYRKLGADELDFSLLPRDIADSDTIVWGLPEDPPIPSSRLTIAWLMSPPAAGSGGHTTIFRMIEGLEAAGHTCVVYLYDRHGSPADYHELVIRRHWPRVKAKVLDARRGLEPADGFVATSWESAHVLGVRRDQPGRRFYFVQDYEPYFYPHGSEYALSADTYNFGFRIMAIGGMVTGLLRSKHGLDVDRIPFGCDTSIYQYQNTGIRNGVVFYAKPNVPRRGYVLAMAALERFHVAHPDQVIHLFGDPAVRPSFPAEVHGTVSPTRLAELYNGVSAGLALSFTNISLVPYEMLACGVVPVMNDSSHARDELRHPEVRWCKPSPGALAVALSSVVTDPEPLALARRAARGAAAGNWDPAQEVVVRAIEAEIYGLAVPPGRP